MSISKRLRTRHWRYASDEISVLPEKPTVAEVLKKFPVFTGNWNFITMFTWSCHWTLFCVIWIQLTPLYLVSLRTILTRPSYTCISQVVSSVPFFQLNFCIYLSLPCVLHSPPSHPPWFDHPNNIWCSAQLMKLLIMQSSSASRHFLLPRFSSEPLQFMFFS
jgi:hypothetical protein